MWWIIASMIAGTAQGSEGCKSEPWVDAFDRVSPGEVIGVNFRGGWGYCSSRIRLALPDDRALIELDLVSEEGGSAGYREGTATFRSIPETVPSGPAVLLFDAFKQTEPLERPVFIDPNRDLGIPPQIEVLHLAPWDRLVDEGHIFATVNVSAPQATGWKIHWFADIRGFGWGHGWTDLPAVGIDDKRIWVLQTPEVSADFCLSYQVYDPFHQEVGEEGVACLSPSDTGAGSGAYVGTGGCSGGGAPVAPVGWLHVLVVLAFATTGRQRGSLSRRSSLR